MVEALTCAEFSHDCLTPIKRIHYTAKFVTSFLLKVDCIRQAPIRVVWRVRREVVYKNKRGMHSIRISFMYGSKLVQ